MYLIMNKVGVFLEKKIYSIILTKLFINLNKFSCVNKMFNLKKISQILQLEPHH